MACVRAGTHACEYRGVSRNNPRFKAIDTIDSSYYPPRMAMGRRERNRQPSMWVTTTDLPTAASHPFYARLNRLLRERGFDEFAEAQCAVFYADTNGRPSSNRRRAAGLPRRLCQLACRSPRQAASQLLVGPAFLEAGATSAPNYRHRLRRPVRFRALATDRCRRNRCGGRTSGLAAVAGRDGDIVHEQQPPRRAVLT